MFGNKRKKSWLEELTAAPIGTVKTVVGRLDPGCGMNGFNFRMTALTEHGWKILDVCPGGSKYQKLITAEKVR